jgi:dihydrofolate reductase
MRKLILSMMMSLDGYVEGPNGEMDWFTINDEIIRSAAGFLGGIDTLIFGRVAYEGMVHYWPSLPSKGSKVKSEVEFAYLMNKLPKIVFSNTMERAVWNASIMHGDITAIITAIKKQPGKDLVLFGGASIAATCIQLNLIDEYRITIHPVLLGGGKSLFKGLSEQRQLKLVNTEIYSTGAVLFYYKPKK